MTEKPKKPLITRSIGTPRKTRDQGYTPFPIRLLELEINAARSSPICAMAATLHISDILHQAALITDDAWNQVKGNTQALISASLIDTVASSLSTVVEAATGGTSDIMEQQAAQTGAAAKMLAAATPAGA